MIRRIPTAIKVPVRAMWLYRNPVALKKFREGLAQAAKRKPQQSRFVREICEKKID